MQLILDIQIVRESLAKMNLIQIVYLLQLIHMYFQCYILNRLVNIEDLNIVSQTLQSRNRLENGHWRYKMMFLTIDFLLNHRFL